jgi:hypothetical protein
VELMTDIERRYMRGVVAPPGVNVTSAPRCGDADRQRAADRVGEAYARGFIEKEEAESRRDAIGQATMAGQLQELVYDIPAMTRFRGASLPSRTSSRAEEGVKWWKARQPWSGLVGAAATGPAAIAPTVLAAVLHAGFWAPLCAAITILPFGLACIASLISLMSWGMEL